MAVISTNTSFTLPTGSTLTFTEGGIGRAIVDGNQYTLGLSDVILGPFTQAKLVQVQVTNAPISYYTLDAPTKADRVPVVVDPLTRIPSPSTSGAVFVPATTKQKFFASLPLGEKFRAQRALAAVPAWSAGVVVKEGYVCQNAGGMYWAMGNLSTGAAVPSSGVTTVTAPTGTGSAVIQTATDNLCWLYLGAYTADVLADDQIDAPSFSVGAIPAACTRRYNTQIAADLAAFYVSGSDFINADASGGGFKGIKAVNYGNSFSIDFVTDAPVVALSAIQNGGGQVLSPMINGAPLWHKCGTGYAWVAGGNNNNWSYNLDWSGKPQRERRVRIPIGNVNQVFTGVHVDPKYNVWAPSNPNRYRFYIEGDSITQLGAPANGGWRSGHRIAAMLGCDDVWDTSSGGTGFLNPGPTTTLIGRMPKVIAAAPDLLYVRPINNDVGNDGTFNSAARIAAYKTYFSTLLAALPNLIIICGGGYATEAANLATDAASAWQVEADMATAISEFAHPQVKFLPTVSDPAGRWLFGNGHVGTTSNSTHGNSDLFVGNGVNDNLHPNVRYYESMLKREVNGIIGIMNSLSF